jgi:hypothetical protein
LEETAQDGLARGEDSGFQLETITIRGAAPTRPLPCGRPSSLALAIWPSVCTRSAAWVPGA